MAIPFLVSDLPIWVHRLWEVILWLVISGLTIYLLVRRFVIGDKVVRWAYFAWVFLYLFQGPVYYFLIISLIPILWGFDSKRFKRTLVLVIIGSIWAGASRVNWVIVPGLLAAALYILEDKINDRTWSRYLLFPGIWVAAGTITALLSWYAYTLWSGSPLGDFGTPFVSNLLWYRLFPNATIKGGVLLTVVLVSAPLLGVIAVRLYKSGFNYHPIRRVIIAAILLILFLGGLIVSTKIGGGNNIHNLDAYLLILLVTGSYVYFDKSPPDFHHPEKVNPHRLSNIFISLAVLIPVLFALHSGKQITLPNPVKTENALLTVKEFAVETASQGGKVLFIGERQLLTFGEVEGVLLIHDYERMNLMEMVMAGRETYLNEFYRRIANQEFALIISEPLTLKYKGRGVRFGDENDVYVRNVSEPVLCYYEPIKTISKFPIQLLKPRLEPENCQ
jgi:hypothetical protein